MSDPREREVQVLGTRSGDPLVSSGVPLGLVPHGGESANKRARMEPHRPLTIDTREQKVRERSRVDQIRPPWEGGREGGREVKKSSRSYGFH